MMFHKIHATALIALALLPANAMAATIEVLMLNRGAEGSMVFEPAFIEADVGDTIYFIATDKGHNVESIKGMLPNGVTAFKSPLNKDYEMKIEAEGLYGLKCTPHYAMGMIALVKVGQPDNAASLAGSRLNRHPAALKRASPVNSAPSRPIHATQASKAQPSCMTAAAAAIN